MQSNPGVVSCLLNERHGLEDGDTVVITEVVGMDEYINNNKYQIKGNYTVILRFYSSVVVSSDKFSINVDTSPSSPYENGGRVKQIKTPVHVNFVSLRITIFLYSSLPFPLFLRILSLKKCFLQLIKLLIFQRWIDLLNSFSSS